jgi:diguanylate cyclase (GGDEF)-like protein
MLMAIAQANFAAGTALDDKRDLLTEMFDHLDRAFALLNLDRTSLLLSNPAFERLVADPSDKQAVLACCKAQAGGGEHLVVLLGTPHVLKLRQFPSGFIVTIDVVAELEAERVRAFEEARRDQVTSLGNRLMLREQLSRSISEGQAGEQIAVFAIDLDRFKAINDTLGHHIGDRLLCKVAERISSALRHKDYAARLGGDEFCVVQVGASQPSDAARLAERLVDLLGRSYVLDGHLVNVGASVGFAICPTDGEDEGTILKNADLAMYAAKARGRSGFCRFEPAMDQAMQARRNLEIDLRRALALREFSLEYQPQYNLKTETITGMEALLRWKSPSRGSVSPADFIPMAEETGLIVQIGEWVLRTACREAASWPAPLTIAVNVSAVQFTDANLIPATISALAESGIAPSRLELEITESVLIQDHTATLKTLQALRDLGVRISMDDFGTGYSSLSYLQSFPFDKLKIDQSFVRGGEFDASKSAIVRAIAAMGSSLGMSTTAEGVETEEQLANILASGCTDVQGYLISRPLSVDKLPDLFSRHFPTHSH